MAVAFGEIKYIAPIETLAGYHRIDRYVKRRRLLARQVLVLCLRDDLAALLQSAPHAMAVAGRAELPGLEATIAAANEAVAALGSDWEKIMEQSDFLWAISWQFQAEYLLHLTTCITVAEHVLKVVPSEIKWLLAPAGAIWPSSADQFGDRNPLWYLVIQAALQEAGRPYRTIGLSLGGQPYFFTGLLRVRIIVNFLLLFLVSLANRLLGLLHALLLGPQAPVAPGGILAFFHEPFSFAPVATVTDSLKQKNISVYRVLHADLGRLRSKYLLPDIAAFYRNIVLILLPSRDGCFIGRVDNRTLLSSWLFLHLQGIRQVGWRDYYRVVREGIDQIGTVWQRINQLPWNKGVRYSMLAYYTRLVVLNYLPEYILSTISLLSLQRQVQPRLVVYPDGYNIMVRLAQIGGQKYNYATVQVPHGYPNRTFPEYYYRADHYLTPGQFSDVQLKDLGHDRKTIGWVQHEMVGAASYGEPNQLPSNQVPVIGLVYSGSYAYWSFPSLYTELFRVTVELIHHIREVMPLARIILKSHPNGTSPYFFEALRNTFQQDFKVGIITHVSRGWAAPADWQQLTAAVAPIIFPSTPTIQFLTSGIPLLFIPGHHMTPSRNMYYPHQRAVPDYPFTMASVTEAVGYLQSLMSDEGRRGEARGAALAYAKKSSVPPAGVPSHSLAETYALLLNQQ